MGNRTNARQGIMSKLLEYIKNNPGSSILSIAENTEIPKTEVSRYLIAEKYEFRPLGLLMAIREHNWQYYIHLLHSARFCVKDGIEGVYINTSKRDMFDRFCIQYGYLLSLDKEGHAFVSDFENVDSDGSERSKILRVLEMDTKNR